MKFAKSNDTANVLYVFGLTLNPDSKDILIMVQGGDVLESYLTDITGKLRAAAEAEGATGKAHLITNEKASAKFEIAKALFAGAAAGLPAN